MNIGCYYKIGDIKSYIDEVCLVTEVKIMNYRSFVKMGELRHVIRLVKLGRVNFINVIRMNSSFL